MNHEEAISLINNSKELSKIKEGFLYLIEKEKNTSAMIALGNISYNNNDVKSAIKYYKKAADYQNPLGFTMLGYLYYYGKSVEKDYFLAFKYFTKGYLNHEYHSTLKLSDMYKNGYYINQNYRYAESLLEPLFDKGMSDFLKGNIKDNPVFDVSLRYAEGCLKGEGVEKDLEKALEYYTLSYYGFSLLMSDNDIEIYNKLKFSLNNVIKLRKELNKESIDKYTVLDFVLDKKFDFSRVIEDDKVTLKFNFKDKTLYICPELMKCFVLDNIDFTFNNIKKFNQMDYEVMRPIDYQFKENIFRLYDEDNTLLHFEFESFNTSLDNKHNFYDLIYLLSLGSVKVNFKDSVEEIIVDETSIKYKDEEYKSIDDFILNNKSLKNKFDLVISLSNI